MKVEIWCEEDHVQHIPPVKAKTLDMDFIPRQGDYIQVHEGWCLSRVERVAFLPHRNSVEITIDSDSTGEFRREAEKPA